MEAKGSGAKKAKRGPLVLPLGTVSVVLAVKVCVHTQGLRSAISSAWQIGFRASTCSGLRPRGMIIELIA